MATSSSPADPLVVGVLGSARLTDDDPRFAAAAEVGTALAAEGWTVMTGGYGGLMQAAGSAAAAAGGQVIGLPMTGWAELRPGAWSTELRWCATYPDRLGHLLACDAVVALDGGIGTLSEMSVVWAAAQTEPAAPRVVAVGPAWRAVVSALGRHLVVGDDDLALVTVVDGPDDVVGAVRAGLATARPAVPEGLSVDDFRLVGMLHLPPLPGIPNYRGTPLADIVEQAVADAGTLTDAGFTHLLLQNASDVPAQTTVAPSTIAVMTRIATQVAAASPLPLGINVAHNDGPGALAIAYAVGAAFIRVKVLTGAAVGPDGVMAGCGLATAELRARLGADVEVWADVNEATSRPLAPDVDDVWAAVEAVKFGGADALVVTKDSGVDDALEVIGEIRRALPAVPLIVGGRVTPATADAVRAGADGAIIGSALKPDGDPFTRVDARRARAFVRTG